MIETTGYVCSLCHSAGRVKRIYASKSSARRHAVGCYRNPSNRACATCEHWEYDRSVQWSSCLWAFDMATGESKPIRNCTDWKLGVRDEEED